MFASRGIILTLGLAVLATTTGCIPYLESGCTRHGIKGTLVDEETGIPLAKTPATVFVGGEKIAIKTSADARFETPPRYSLYWTWIMCGPILVAPSEQPIEIQVDGYESYKTLAFPWEPITCPVVTSRPTNGTMYDMEGDYFALRKIRLKKKAASTP